jgi:hypothetical protein
MAQAVECLPSKRKALHSNPSTTKIQQQQQKKLLHDFMIAFIWK